MFWNVLRMERDKVLKRRIWWIELIVLLGIYMLLGFAFVNASGQMKPTELSQLTWPGGVMTVFQLSSATSTLILIILVGTLTGQEYSWRTMQLWLSNGVARPVLLTAKLLVLYVIVVLTVLVSVGAGAGVTAFLTFLVHGSVPVEHMNFGEAVLGILRACYVLLPYTTLTFMLAVIARSSLVAVSGSLIYVLIVESLVAQLLGPRVLLYLPGGLMRAFLSQNAAIIGTSVPTTQPPAISAIGIALYTLIFLGVTIWVFQRQDLTN